MLSALCRSLSHYYYPIKVSINKRRKTECVDRNRQCQLYHVLHFSFTRYATPPLTLSLDTDTLNIISIKASFIKLKIMPTLSLLLWLLLRAQAESRRPANSRSTTRLRLITMIQHSKSAILFTYTYFDKRYGKLSYIEEN
jgi:hypothetical protein